MANLQLKKIILEVVDNQINTNNPPCTKVVYESLKEAGYSKSEAKEKIGAIVLTEIYDILKAGKDFDEEKYKSSLEKMLQQSIDYESDYHVRTEWDEWDQLVQEGYECFDDDKREEGLQLWNKAWEVFQSIVNQQSEKVSVHQLMEEQDYIYAIDGWIQDYEMELGNARKSEEKISYCKKILELFDWTYDNNASCFKCGIADSLFDLGKKDEAFEFYENWLDEEPRNYNGISGYSWILIENGETQKAYEVVRRAIWGASCNVDNSFLFMHAKQLAKQSGKHEECKWYQEQLDKFEVSIHNWEMEEDAIFDEFTMPKQIPVIKPEKIYPNDPCSCGSGKKYKKCCGRNK